MVRETSKSDGSRMQSLLENRLGLRVTAVEPVSGGCIATSFRVDTEAGSRFVKTGEGNVAESLKAEADGLRHLGAAESGLLVPGVHAMHADGERIILVLDWVEEKRPDTASLRALGHGLARLHRTSREAYGHERDNFIGRLPQQNKVMRSWVDFFRTQRLEPQITRARAAGRWSADWDGSADYLLDHLERWLPDTPVASLLHGDLWSGNFMAPSDGGAALIDPAVYFGDRETDVAMTELFGGFGSAFYEAYNDMWPLDSGYADRKDIYNLYHLINHLNHFGAGYAGSVQALLRKFG